MTLTEKQQLALRAIPAIDEILRSGEVCLIAEKLGDDQTLLMIRQICEELRREILATPELPLNLQLETQLRARVITRLNFRAKRDLSDYLRPVINATGVVLHTNLGRAPLAESAREAMVERAAGYCTVEYDLESGSRGRRGRKAEELLAEMTGAEAGVVVNNGAAAALLVLTALTNGGEVVLSRGELVEIGGDFRIPDVMLSSGAALSEVGTTNRTKIADYERAITPKTVMLMRVHPSNYRLVGFTAAPELRELAELAHARGLWLYEDAGSGALVELTEHGLTGEPVISDSIAAGADVVSFSGDKLMGGVQAGLIVGRAELLDRIRRHPLYRALRPDKTTLAAVEATLSIYRRGAELTEIPALVMLAMQADAIKARAEAFIDRYSSVDAKNFSFKLVPGQSAIGGGSAPTTHPATMLIALMHQTQSADQLAAALRRHDPPVIARIVDGRVVLDLRTVSEKEEPELLTAIASLG